MQQHQAAIQHLMPPERFKETCLRSPPSASASATISASGYEEPLARLIDYFLDARKRLSPLAADIQLFRSYLTGGMAFDEFKQALKAFDASSVCGLVWNINYVAYRCRTCALSPCMSICAECFRAGDHTGHDYNMFRSGAGGACDCGDACVMKPSGFCRTHSHHHHHNSSEPPPHSQQQQAPDRLVKCFAVLVGPFLYRLLQSMRAAYSGAKIPTKVSRCCCFSFAGQLMAKII